MEQTIIPTMIRVTYASGDAEVVNLTEVRRIRFRKTGAVIVMADGNLAEIVDTGAINAGPYDWAEIFCKTLNNSIVHAMCVKGE